MTNTAPLSLDRICCSYWLHIFPMRNICDDMLGSYRSLFQRTLAVWAIGKVCSNGFIYMFRKLSPISFMSNLSSHFSLCVARKRCCCLVVFVCFKYHLFIRIPFLFYFLQFFRYPLFLSFYFPN